MRRLQEDVTGKQKGTFHQVLQSFVDEGPYFLGQGMAQPHTSDMERWTTLLGTILHVALWTSAFAIDTNLLVHDFFNPEEETLHLLHLVSWSTLTAAATLVLLSFSLHIVSALCSLPFSFNDGHLPAFLSTLILGCARISLEFSKFSLFYFFFIVEFNNVLEVPAHARNMLIAQVCLKQIGVSFTANAHRFAVRGLAVGTTMVAPHV